MNQEGHTGSATMMTAEHVRMAIESAIAVARSDLACEQSEELGELVKALCKARKDFGPIEKGREAKIKGTAKKSGRDYEYRYRYASLDLALSATSEALADNELVVFQTFGEQGRDDVTVVTELRHSSDQWKRTRICMPCGRDPQSLGSAVTYARRYSYFAILSLSPEEDDDGAAARRGQSESGGDAKPAGEQAAASVREFVVKGDVEGAWRTLSEFIKDNKDCSDLAPGKVRRLLGDASKKGWPEERVDGALRYYADCSANSLPWKAFDAALALFTAVSPPPRKSREVESPPTALKEQSGSSHPQVANMEPQAVETPDEAEPSSPSWEEVWRQVKEEVGRTSSTEENLGAAGADGLLETVAEEIGWTPGPVLEVLSNELNLTPAELPKLTSSGKPFQHWIIHALRKFDPNTVKVRYGKGSEAESQEGRTQEQASNDLTKILSTGFFPLSTEEDSWGALRGVLESLREDGGDAENRICPDSKMRCYRRSDNGGRSPRDAAMAIAEGLQLNFFEELPEVLVDAVLRLLSAFPEIKEMTLPEGWRSLRIAELRELANSLVSEGFLSTLDISGKKGGLATKAELLEVIEDREKERKASNDE